jgi:hypothetical protein
MPRIALGSLVALGLLAGGYLALAQINIGSQGFFGNEVIEVAQGGPGGPSTYGTVGRISSGYSYAYFTSFPATFTIGTVSGTTNTAGMANGGVLLINAAAAGTTVYTFPPNPVIDGTIVGVCNATATLWAGTANTVAANSGQTLVGSGVLTALAASTCARYVWNQPVATWFRVQ